MAKAFVLGERAADFVRQNMIEGEGPDVPAGESVSSVRHQTWVKPNSIVGTYLYAGNTGSMKSDGTYQTHGDCYIRDANNLGLNLRFWTRANRIGNHSDGTPQYQVENPPPKLEHLSNDPTQLWFTVFPHTVVECVAHLLSNVYTTTNYYGSGGILVTPRLTQTSPTYIPNFFRGQTQGLIINTGVWNNSFYFNMSTTLPMEFTITNNTDNAKTFFFGVDADGATGSLIQVFGTKKTTYI